MSASPQSMMSGDRVQSGGDPPEGGGGRRQLSGRCSFYHLLCG